MHLNYLCSKWLVNNYIRLAEYSCSRITERWRHLPSAGSRKRQRLVYSISDRCCARTLRSQVRVWLSSGVKWECNKMNWNVISEELNERMNYDGLYVISYFTMYYIFKYPFICYFNYIITTYCVIHCILPKNSCLSIW